MKHRKLIDKAIVAALLLAYVPGLAEDMQHCDLPEPVALMAAEPSASQEDDHNQGKTAFGL